jgi:hypothetical protein
MVYSRFMWRCDFARRLALVILAPRHVASRFAVDCRGVTTSVVALSLIPIVGFAGLATETAAWYLTKRKMQSAADSAAFSAAVALGAGESSALFTTEADSVAASYNYVAGSGGVTVTVNNPPISGPNTSQSSAVEVIISQPQHLLLSSLFLGQALTIEARSVATGGSGSGCVLALDTANVTDESISGGAKLNLNNRSLYINSSSSQALNMSGGASVNAFSAYIVGNYTLSGGASLTTTKGTFTGVSPISDPYASVPIPSYSGCNQSNFNLSGGASLTLSAGSAPYVFCNGINLSGGASLTLNSGVYVIDRGSLNISGGTTFDASGGVTIVLTSSTGSNYATANISGGANVTVTAPTTGPTAGLAFFQDRNAPSSGTDSFSGGASQVITGAIYFPHQALNYSGGTSTGGSNCTQLIGYTMTFSGGSTFNNNCAGVGTAAIGSAATIVE